MKITDVTDWTHERLDAWLDAQLLIRCRSTRLLDAYCRRARVRDVSGSDPKFRALGYSYSRALKWEARKVVD